MHDPSSSTTFATLLESPHDMLQLQQTLTGYPAAGVQYLHLPKESLIVSLFVKTMARAYFW